MLTVVQGKLRHTDRYRKLRAWRAPFELGLVLQRR